MPKARKITPRTPTSSPAPPVLAVAADRLLGDVRALIEAAREQTARAQLGTCRSLLAHRHPYPAGHPPGETGQVRRGDSRDAVATIDGGVWAGVLEAESVTDERRAEAFQDRGAVFHAVRSNVSPQAKMRSTGMRQPGTAGSASATWPRRKITGCSGASARYTFTHAAIGSTSQTTTVPASK